jgi:DNA invertase Pin-like site-specific DNA recombinase
MIDRACDGTKSVDAVVVHSFSRFMRDSFALEFYLRKLAKHGVKLISITQDVTEDDPAQAMMRKVIALFDEYQSKENAKHTLRAMKENARQGFWNGSRPPFGYSAVEVERRGARIKKKLAVDLVEADQIKLIFRLFLEGDGQSGPMGIKAIVTWLNARGLQTRGGARWGVGPLHKLITNPVYAGQMRFNRHEGKTNRRKAEAEYVFADVPAIISSPVFARVQALLKERNPRVTPPRVVTGPILLTGLAICASCLSSMTLRTGTSRSGRVHRYYACSANARQGKEACKGRFIRMDKLDSLVTNQLIDRLLQPERLRDLLSALAERRSAKQAEVDARMYNLEAKAAETDDRLRRLYRLVETGEIEMDDLLKSRITELRAEREITLAATQRMLGTSSPAIALKEGKVAAFSRLMRGRLTEGEVPFRKAYLGALIDRIEVDDQVIRIVGRKDVLERAVGADGVPTPAVRSFVRKWRPVGESVLRDLSRTCSEVRHCNRSIGFSGLLARVSNRDCRFTDSIAARFSISALNRKADGS